MNTQLIACEYQILDEVDSTNDALKKLSNQKELPEGFCLRSLYQTSGRGQYGKQWDSLPDENLLMSVYLKPVFLPAAESYRLTMSVCLALHDLGKSLDLNTEIKWPNDWFYKGQKIAGILAESSLRGGNMESCIMGIGINVRQKSFDFSNATSLSLIKQEGIEPQEVFELLVPHLDDRYTQLRMGLKHQQHREFNSILFGQSDFVPVQRGTIKTELKCLSVEANGALNVLWKDGRQERLNHQEIKFLF